MIQQENFKIFDQNFQIFDQNFQIFEKKFWKNIIRKKWKNKRPSLRFQWKKKCRS